MPDVAGEGGRPPAEREEEFRAPRSRLLRAEALAILGTLVVDLLHDLNTPLAAARGFAQVLLEQDLPPEVQGDLRHVYEGIEDALHLLRRFREFARDLPARRVPVDLNTLLQNAVALRRHSLRSGNVEVHLDLDLRLPLVEGLPGPLGLAFMSLLLNAEQAMVQASGEGVLRVRTSSPQQDTVRVEIADDGPGIPEEVQGRLFQPFVSTKGDRGTGLGLTLARHVVEAHGGRLWFVTETGTEGPSGTTFFVELPAAPSPEPIPEAMVDTSAREPSPARGRILVVDDEKNIRDLVRRALLSRGHTVDTAETVERALALARQQAYQAILCDIRMPGPGGTGFYRSLLSMAPDLAPRVIFMTGSALDPDVEAFLAETGCLHLQKPFALEDLLEVVERLLAGRTPAKGHREGNL
ncbi:MAG: hybrid sensor histidine kinase/response regulator [Anaerolineae bacterium]